MKTRVWTTIGMVIIWHIQFSFILTLGLGPLLTAPWALYALNKIQSRNWDHIWHFDFWTNLIMQYPCQEYHKRNSKSSFLSNSTHFHHSQAEIYAYHKIIFCLILAKSIFSLTSLHYYPHNLRHVAERQSHGETNVREFEGYFWLQLTAGFNFKNSYYSTS